ncbi:hypothetical protein SEA_LILYPAD_70 [Gordonia phage LilyPad]|nr:hypothetical protein SEA_LILYPAD_70 [Gordonia phage LilyPad]
MATQYKCDNCQMFVAWKDLIELTVEDNRQSYALGGRRKKFDACSPACMKELAAKRAEQLPKRGK